MDLTALIEAARGLVRPAPTAEALRAQEPLVALFDAAAAAGPPRPEATTAFVFHNPVPEGRLRVSFPDVRLDHAPFDFAAVLARFAARARRHGASVVVATGDAGPPPVEPSDGVAVVRLPLDPAAPMHERVRAMHAFVRSRQFAAPTAFLDSDAFPNGDLSLAFRRPFDVAVTWRALKGLMPLNEGAIFARPDRPDAVRSFFDAYLGTYGAIAADPAIAAGYGDVRVWRGGQLSLNAVAAAGEVSPFERRTVGGARVAYLPCETFNHAVTEPAQLAPERTRGRLVLHLKGSAKSLLDLLDADEDPPWPADPPPAAPAAPAGFVAPHFAQFNKSWGEPPLHDPAARRTLGRALASVGEALGANRPGGRAALADDLFVWFRTLGFLSDPEFVEAFRPYADDPTLRARIWRVHVLCWAARSCLALDGDFADFGCYDGRTVDVVQRYADFARTGGGRRWVLYDMFEDPPAESRKAAHGPDLFGRVRAMFSAVPGVEVVKGALPGSCAGTLPERIAFAQVDLNDADAEVATIEAIADRLVPGGIVVLDDYGFERYRESHAREKALFASRGLGVLELPTGQGLVVAR